MQNKLFPTVTLSLPSSRPAAKSKAFRKNVRLLKPYQNFPKAIPFALRSLQGLSFLTGEEINAEELNALLDFAMELKAEKLTGQAHRHLEGRHLAMLFEKPSLRTRFSFTVGMNDLGGLAIDSESSNRKDEEPEDLVRVLAGFCNAVMLRTHEHATLERMAKMKAIPVINGLSDTHHPCQALADLLTIRERYGDCRGLTLTYIGDGNNVLHSLLLLAPLLGIHVRYACPERFKPDAMIVARATKRAFENDATIEDFTDPQLAAQGAHVLYTDVWTSMGFEEETEAREAIFKEYQINTALLEMAHPQCIIMHCLPMIRGKEITSEAVEHDRSVLFQQSENRLHAQKALLCAILCS